MNDLFTKIQVGVLVFLIFVLLGLMVYVFITPAWACKTSPNLDMYGLGSKYTDPGQYIIHADPNEEFVFATYESEVFSSLHNCGEGRYLLKVAEGDKGKTLLLKSNERGRLGVNVDPFPIGSK